MCRRRKIVVVFYFITRASSASTSSSSYTCPDRLRIIITHTHTHINTRILYSIMTGFSLRHIILLYRRVRAYIQHIYTYYRYVTVPAVVQPFPAVLARALYAIPKTAVSVYILLLLYRYKVPTTHSSWSCVRRSERGGRGAVVGTMTRLRNERADRRRDETTDVCGRRWYSDSGYLPVAIVAGRSDPRRLGNSVFFMYTHHTRYIILRYVYIISSIGRTRVPNVRPAQLDFSDFYYYYFYYIVFRKISPTPHPATDCRYRDICRVSCRSNLLLLRRLQSLVVVYSAV